MFAAVGFSLSRMGFVATLVSFLVMGVLGFGHGRIAMAEMAAGRRASVSCSQWPLCSCSPSALVERFGAMVTGAEEGRAAIWKDAGGLIRSYPLFGVGFGNFYPGILRYQTSGLSQPGPLPTMISCS